ncbi:MAG: putative DNA binding domain-containing protein [bacterium]|nr:putative DNA binding domain-containing protein [bacterium]
MYNEIITKRSPIVLMWKFAGIEAVGFLFYFIAMLLGNTKYELYTQLSFSNFLSYQAAKMLFLLSAQFALTVYAFLSWYYEEYAVGANSITHTSGVFLKKESVFPVGKTTSQTIKSGPLGKLFHYGSIRLRSDGSSITLAQISRPERIIKVLKGEYNPYENAFGKEPDIAKLLTEAEHDKLEFKSSLRFDQKSGNANRELEKAAMKTIAAFLNSKGGYLVIGVSDKRTPLGLQNDYQTLQRKDSDGFENHFTQAFNNMIGPEFRNLVKLWFHNADGNDICAIQALESPRPVYLKIDNNEHFYMRTGNISTSLKLSEIESYARSRWPKRIS